MKLDDDDDHLIEAAFHTGAITVVGVVLSFSLSFLTQWANNPLPWNLVDLPPVFLIALGITFEIFALATLLSPNSLKRKVYDKAKRTFLIGIIITSTGVASAIVIDAVKLLDG